MSQATNAPARERSPADVMADAVQDMKHAGVLRRVRVELRLDAEAADGVPIGDLLVDALGEFIAAVPSRRSGEFESKAGIDVTWDTYEACYAGGVQVSGKGPVPPVPTSIAHTELNGDHIVILGVRYHLSVFRTLANPDESKRYMFTRQGDTVTVVERP